jgi:hypothetical protein
MDIVLVILIVLLLALGGGGYYVRRPGYTGAGEGLSNLLVIGASIVLIVLALRLAGIWR